MAVIAGGLVFRFYGKLTARNITLLLMKFGGGLALKSILRIGWFFAKDKFKPQLAELKAPQKVKEELFNDLPSIVCSIIDNCVDVAFDTIKEQKFIPEHAVKIAKTLAQRPASIQRALTVALYEAPDAKIPVAMIDDLSSNVAKLLHLMFTQMDREASALAKVVFEVFELQQQQQQQRRSQQQQAAEPLEISPELTERGATALLDFLEKIQHHHELKLAMMNIAQMAFKILQIPQHLRERVAPLLTPELLSQLLNLFVDRHPVRETRMSPRDAIIVLARLATSLDQQNPLSHLSEAARITPAFFTLLLSLVQFPYLFATIVHVGEALLPEQMRKHFESVVASVQQQQQEVQQAAEAGESTSATTAIPRSLKSAIPSWIPCLLQEQLLAPLFRSMAEEAVDWATTTPLPPMHRVVTGLAQRVADTLLMELLPTVLTTVASQPPKDAATVNYLLQLANLDQFARLEKVDWEAPVSISDRVLPGVSPDGKPLRTRGGILNLVPSFSKKTFTVRLIAQQLIAQLQQFDPRPYPLTEEKHALIDVSAHTASKLRLRFNATVEEEEEEKQVEAAEGQQNNSSSSSSSGGSISCLSMLVELTPRVGLGFRFQHNPSRRDLSQLNMMSTALAHVPNPRARIWIKLRDRAPTTPAAAAAAAAPAYRGPGRHPPSEAEKLPDGSYVMRKPQIDLPPGVPLEVVEVGWEDFRETFMGQFGGGEEQGGGGDGRRMPAGCGVM